MSELSSYATWEDYYWPDAPGVLINKFGIKDADKLADAELHATAARMRGVLLDDTSALPETIDLDYYCELHGRIFQDVYEWAGAIRNVPDTHMTKEWRDVLDHDPDDLTAPKRTYRYPPGPSVEGRTGSMFTFFDMALEQPQNRTVQGFIPTLADHWITLDRSHPFREGNTRSQTILMAMVCRKYGFELDGEELYARREDFLAARFYGHADGNYTRMTTLLLDTVRVRQTEQITDREQAWANSLADIADQAAADRGNDNALEL